jgi:hypothetical protein
VKVRIALQQAQGFMTAYAYHFQLLKTFFKQTGYRFIPEIMEPEIF